MDPDTLKSRIARLSRHAFSEFVTTLFNEGDGSGGTKFAPLSECGEDVFFQPYLDSYGYSIHDVYTLHSPPIHLFQPSRQFKIEDPYLIERLVRIRNHYKGRAGYWGMVSPELRKDDALKTVGILTNIFGIDRSVYDDMLIPAYQRLKRFCGMKKPILMIGSADSFLDLNPDSAIRAFEKVACDYSDGVTISFYDQDVAVRDFATEKCLFGGVVQSTHCPYEPVFVSEAIRQRATLHEFETLLRSEPSEAELESFLVENYMDVFGNKYDRIETQLWLRFPDIDISDKNRRLDVFLRNSVVNDWELFEVKRLDGVSRKYRDVPALVAEVTGALHQTKNYARTLAQDRVKQHFAKQGIEYFEPQLSIVVGRTPDIPHDQWRWLRIANEDSVRLITFDDLHAELRCRLDERYAVIQGLQAKTAT